MNKRILPYNIDVIDVERSVLGAVMLNRRALTDVLEIVKSIVDYIQLMEDKENNASRQNEVASISRSLKLLAREMDCPVIALSQLSRGTEGRSNNHKKG
ncbi:DnaB-like helicase C-terminal domain-containing protein [Mobilibacterium timonense]|uniref:DnaB-like helicase C-terminal domain-containing protein n=1 Tax=Mobilibacterium timonense TaxID=1871012 RepID=UPI003A8D048B